MATPPCPPACASQIPLVIAATYQHKPAASSRGSWPGARARRRLLAHRPGDQRRALVALYNAAAMVVHPSRYEGFGLPVLEAMQTGTPVITTTASSLPEVARRRRPPRRPGRRRRVRHRHRRRLHSPDRAAVTGRARAAPTPSGSVPAAGGRHPGQLPPGGRRPWPGPADTPRETPGDTPNPAPPGPLDADTAPAERHRRLQRGAPRRARRAGRRGGVRRRRRDPAREPGLGAPHLHHRA